MLRTNLLTNPTFEDGTTGWLAYGTGVSISAQTTGGLYGDKCLLVTKAAVSNAGVRYTPEDATVTVGDVYTASAYVKIPTGQDTGDIKVGIGFYDSSDTIVGSIQYSAATSVSVASGWTRIYNTYTAPSTSVYALVYVVQSTSGTAGKTFLVDGVQLENSSDPTQFVDPLTQTQEFTRVNNTLRRTPMPHLTGMELNADIMLNGRVFNTFDEDDILWVCTDIQGWWDLPDPEIPDLTRGLDDGSYDVRGRFTARTMTFEGSVIPPNRDLVPEARRRLIEALNMVHIGGWLFVDEDPTKAAYVRLSGRPKIEVVNPRGRIDFSVGLRAANPVKFEWNWNDDNGYVETTVANGGSSTIANDGNTDVPVILTLTGGLTAPITIQNSTKSETLTVIKNLRDDTYSVNITNSARTTAGVVTLTVASHNFLAGDVVSISGVTTAGRTNLNEAGVTITSVTATTIIYTSSETGSVLASDTTDGAIGLDSDDVLIIDTYNKSATFNGSSLIARSYIDTLVDWITLQPGNNTVAFADSGGSTTLSVKHRSGWIG